MLGFHNDIEFELSSDKRDSIIVDEPLNWDSDDKSYEMDSEGKGTLMKMNTELEFRKDGMEWLYSLPLAFGFDATATVTKKGKDTLKLGEDWRSFYRANLDLLAASWGDNTVKIPFTQGGLYDKIINRYSDTYDLVNTKSADNIEIGELSTIIENITGREIFRSSNLKVEDLTQEEFEFSGGDRDNSKAVPFQVVDNSDQDHVNGVTLGANGVGYNNGDYTTGSTAYMLYDRANVAKTITLNGKINIRVIDTNDGTLELHKIFYDYDEAQDEYIYDRREQLGQSLNTGTNLAEMTYEFDNEEIPLEQGQSVAIVIKTRIEGYTFGPKKIVLDYRDTKLNIKLDDVYPPTVSKNLLPHEKFERLLQKITGEKGLLISKTLGRKELGYEEDGEWALLSTTSGFWARGFDIEEAEPRVDGQIDPPKQFNISLKDCYSSYSVIQPLFWGIETISGKDYFRLENYNFTQRDFIGVKLGRTVLGEFKYIPVQKAERTILSEDLFTKLTFGYEEGGNDYEEVIGLSSPHGKAEFNTCLKDKEPAYYEQISKIRADIEGHELARIKQSIFFRDEDTPYDQSIFFRDLIKDSAGYRLRKWQDDFNEAPSGGVYSPDTTGNLRLTPKRCLLRHKRIIATGLFPQPYEYITFASSNCFSGLIVGDLKEDEPILNKDLGKPYSNGFMLTFEGKVYQEMIDQLEGYTIVNNERIPNVYGLFEAMTKEGDLVRGRLIKSSINGNGNHEIAEV